jgi:hypothetical protein
MALLNDDGQLGFLVPNSILRVKQFTKIRDFILNKARLWKIVDEGSPFVGVTLEMVSLFMEKVKSNGDHHIRVESRRNGLEQTNVVAHSVLSESGIFSIYHEQPEDVIYLGFTLEGIENPGMISLTLQAVGAFIDTTLMITM